MRRSTSNSSRCLLAVGALSLAFGSGCSSSSGGSNPPGNTNPDASSQGSGSGSEHTTGSGSGSAHSGGGGEDSGSHGSGTGGGGGDGSGTGGGGSDDAGGVGGDGAGGGDDAGGGGGNDAGGGTSSCTQSNATCVSDNQACNVGSTYDLYDNQWNCGSNSCGPESAYGCLNADGSTTFVISSEQAAGNTAVLSYPAMQLNLSNNPTLSSLASVKSSFTVDPPSGSNSDWEVAYDLWFNNYDNEFMVWVYNNGQTPAGSKVASSVSLGGKSYDIWWSPNGGTNGTVTFEMTTNVTSASDLDLLTLFTYASQHGWLPTSSTAVQFDFGVEVCSTNGVTQLWTISDYSTTVM